MTADQLDTDTDVPAPTPAPKSWGRCTACGRRTATANLVSGPDGRYGPKCAEKLGLVIRMFRAPARTAIPSLFPEPAQEAAMHKRFIVRRDSRTLIEGVRFSDGKIAVHYLNPGVGQSGWVASLADVEGDGTLTWLDPPSNVPDAMQPSGLAAELADQPTAPPAVDDAAFDTPPAGPAAGHPLTHAGPSPDAE